MTDEMKPAKDVGIKVMLNSGGPAMTIVKNEHGALWCKWFDGPHSHEGFFPEEAVTIVEGTDGVIRTIGQTLT